ncbi:MAG: hypothetical protein ACRD1U_04435, partial [Vicinamibacterales bacterium]
KEGNPMRVLRSCSALAVVCAVATCVETASASMIVRHMDLQQMCKAAGRIFRGTVLGVSEGTVTAGGGQLATMVYTIRVDESFKGAFQTIKGQRIATLQIVRRAKRTPTGILRRLAALDDLPSFRTGHDYLILATTPSAAGLSSTVGMKQGVFKVEGKAGQETAINGNRNIGLNAGVTDAASRGPIPYAALRDSIRRFVGR